MNPGATSHRAGRNFTSAHVTVLSCSTELTFVPAARLQGTTLFQRRVLRAARGDSEALRGRGRSYEALRGRGRFARLRSDSEAPRGRGRSEAPRGRGRSLPTPKRCGAVGGRTHQDGVLTSRHLAAALLLSYQRAAVRRNGWDGTGASDSAATAWEKEHPIRHPQHATKTRRRLKPPGILRDAIRRPATANSALRAIRRRR